MKELKAGEGDETIERAEAVESPEYSRAEPGHEATVNDHGIATEEGVPPSILVEEKEEGCK